MRFNGLPLVHTSSNFKVVSNSSVELSSKSTNLKTMSSIGHDSTSLKARII